MRAFAVVWFTGIPSSGKTSLATRVLARLRDRNVEAVLLDGDAVRAAIVPPFGYDDAGRENFYESLAQLAAFHARQGHVVLVPATAHLNRFRERARALAPRFIEVHVDVGPAEAERRDIGKNLYRDARARDDAGLPGQGAAYERPTAAEVVASGAHDDAAIERIVSLVEDPALQPLEDVYVGLAIRPTGDLLRAQSEACAAFDLRPRRDQHITLVYLGRSTAAEAEALSDRLDAGLPAEIPARLVVTGSGGAVRWNGSALEATPESLRRSDANRVLWWSLERTPALLALQKLVSRAALGNERNAEDFWPHLTVGSNVPESGSVSSWDVHGIAKPPHLGSLHCPAEVFCDRLHLTCGALPPSSWRVLRFAAR